MQSSGRISWMQGPQALSCDDEGREKKCIINLNDTYFAKNYKRFGLSEEKESLSWRYQARKYSL